MRALVTGATGFLGSHLVRALLEAGHEVVAFRRPGAKTEAIDGLAIEHLLGDLGAGETIFEEAARSSKADVVFHLAGAYSVWSAIHPELYRVNVLGTRAVVRACLKLGLKLVKTGTCVPYAGTREPVVCDEDGNGDLTRWSSFHAVGMALAERELLKGAARGLFAVQLDPGLILGERDIHYHAAWVFAAARRRGVLGRLYAPGGMNLVDVRDVVRAHLLALERGRAGETYLVGGQNLTTERMLGMADEVMAGEPRLRFELPRLPLRALGIYGEIAGRLRGDDARNRMALNVTGAELSSLYWWFSSAKAARELGYRAGPVRPAMEREWQWLRERFEARGRGGATPR